MKMWNKRYCLTPNRKSNSWYLALYYHPSFEFKFVLDTWTLGIWVFGIGIAFEKFPF
jgi:hypothetical protein